MALWGRHQAVTYIQIKMGGIDSIEYINSIQYTCVIYTQLQKYTIYIYIYLGVSMFSIQSHI